MLARWRDNQEMPIDRTELDRMQSAYKAAVNLWIDAIRSEEALASAIHEVAEVDKWEEEANREEEARNKAKAAKAAYEAALRKEFFNF
jgi:DNA-directed RNA polymerase specialized sigma24 family protein